MIVTTDGMATTSASGAIGARAAATSAGDATAAKCGAVTGATDAAPLVPDRAAVEIAVTVAACAATADRAACLA